MRSLRFDTFRLDTVERTPTGGLKIQATPTRAGVLTYRRADGSQVRELRHPSEVFSEDSLATLRGATVTDLHPPSGAVTPDTWKNASVGHVGETVQHDGKLVHATLYVNDADAIQKIQSGERKELSAGYYADTDETPGIHEGQRYDRRQTGIRYNHVSLQPPGGGRAGPECALRIDSDDAILVDTGQAVPDPAVMTLRIDGKEATQDAIDALTADRDKARGALAASEAKVKDLTKRCDAAEDPKRIAAEVSKRVTLLGQIRKGNAFFLDADDEPADDGEEKGAADPIALMTEALEKWQPGIDIKGKSPEFIMGAFAAMMADVTGDEEKEPTTQAQDALTPAKNTAPEMELNGRSRGDGRTSRSVQARRGLHADRGGVRQDDRGFPTGGRTDERPLTAEERQRKDNQERSTQPMAASRKD